MISTILNLKKFRLKLDYVINDLYNLCFIKKNHLYDKLVLVDKFQNNSPAKIHANVNQTVWLLNIKRLIKMASIDCREYSFIDVGCGNGIALCYANKKFLFKDFEGFDFETSSVEIAKSNLKKINPSSVVTIGDAANFKLQDKCYFVYMFNPFDQEVMSLFIKNNIDTLKKHHSIIAYANDKYLDTLKSLDGVNVTRNEHYKISVIKF